MQMCSSKFLHVMHVNEGHGMARQWSASPAQEKTLHLHRRQLQPPTALPSDLLSNLTLTSVCRQTIRSPSRSANGNETGTVLRAAMTLLWVKLLCWRRCTGNVQGQRAWHKKGKTPGPEERLLHRKRLHLSNGERQTLSHSCIT